MPTFDFTPTWIGLAGVIFIAFATACVTTTDERAFVRVFTFFSAICGAAVLLATAAAWVAWKVFFT